MRPFLWFTTVVTVVVALCLSQDVSAEPPTPSELLRTYEQSLQRIQRIRFEADVTSKWQDRDGIKGKSGSVWKVLRDNARWNLSCQRTTTITSQDGSISTEDSAYECLAPPTDGFADLRIQLDAPTGKFNYLVANRKPNPQQADVWAEDDFMLVFGHLQGNGRMMYLPAILRESNLTTSEQALQGENVFVLRGKGRFGAYSLWLDPKHGSLPRRISVRKTLSDYAGDRQLSSFRGVREMKADVEVSRLEKFGDVHLMTEFAILYQTLFSDGSRQSQTTCRLSKIDVSPNVSTSDAFKVSVDIPNGTPVQVNDAPGIEYVWKDDRILKLVDTEYAKDLRGRTFVRGMSSARRWVLGVTVVLLIVLTGIFAIRRLPRST